MYIFKKILTCMLVFCLCAGPCAAQLRAQVFNAPADESAVIYETESLLQRVYNVPMALGSSLSDMYEQQGLYGEERVSMALEYAGEALPEMEGAVKDLRVKIEEMRLAEINPELNALINSELDYLDTRIKTLRHITGKINNLSAPGVRFNLIRNEYEAANKETMSRIKDFNKSKNAIYSAPYQEYTINQRRAKVMLEKLKDLAPKMEKFFENPSAAAPGLLPEMGAVLVEAAEFAQRNQTALGQMNAELDDLKESIRLAVRKGHANRVKNIDLVYSRLNSKIEELYGLERAQYDVLLSVSVSYNLPQLRRLMLTPGVTAEVMQGWLAGAYLPAAQNGAQPRFAAADKASGGGLKGAGNIVGVVIIVSALGGTLWQLFSADKKYLEKQNAFIRTLSAEYLSEADTRERFIKDYNENPAAAASAAYAYGDERAAQTTWEIMRRTDGSVPELDGAVLASLEQQVKNWEYFTSNSAHALAVWDALQEFASADVALAEELEFEKSFNGPFEPERFNKG